MKILKKINSSHLSHLQRDIYWMIVGKYGFQIYWVDYIDLPNANKYKLGGITVHNENTIYLSKNTLRESRRMLTRAGMAKTISPLTLIMVHELAHIAHLHLYDNTRKTARAKISTRIPYDKAFNNFFKKQHPLTYDICYSDLIDNLGMFYYDSNHYIEEEQRKIIKDNFVTIAVSV